MSKSAQQQRPDRTAAYVHDWFKAILKRATKGGKLITSIDVSGDLLGHYHLKITLSDKSVYLARGVSMQDILGPEDGFCE